MLVVVALATPAVVSLQPFERRAAMPSQRPQRLRNRHPRPRRNLPASSRRGTRHLQTRDRAFLRQYGGKQTTLQLQHRILPLQRVLAAAAVAAAAAGHRHLLLLLLLLQLLLLLLSQHPLLLPQVAIPALLYWPPSRNVQVEVVDHHAAW